MLKRYANCADPSVFWFGTPSPLIPLHKIRLTAPLLAKDSLAVDFAEELIILLGLLLGIWSEKLLQWLWLELITLPATVCERNPSL